MIKQEIKPLIVQNVKMKIAATTFTEFLAAFGTYFGPSSSEYLKKQYENF